MDNQYSKFCFAVMAVGFLLLGIQTPLTAQQQPDTAAVKEKPKYAPGRFIVKFKSEGPNAVNDDTQYLLEHQGNFQSAVSDQSDSLDKLKRKHNVTKAKSLFVERYGLTTHAAREKQIHMRQLSKVMHQSQGQRAPQDATAPDLSNIYVVEVPSESDIEAIVQEFQSDPHVEYAQPDYIMEANMVPNEPYYFSYGSWGQSYDDLWGLKKIQTEQAWDTTQGEGIIVAVVDSGLDYNHPDIAANVWTNLGEIPNNGLDDDGNGKVDDIRGWDFYNADKDPMDDHGHGTHVSGTIAAVGNNGIGIIGVAPKVKIMPLKGLGATGTGSTSALANGIIYAAQNGADVINNSWGCLSACPSNPTAENAVRTAYSLGAVVVFAAGNDNANVANYSPQNMVETITVAASNYLDQRASFSNYGSFIGVTAPGVGILSLRRNSTGYTVMQGTSMAAPHVSGLVALLLSMDPTLDQLQVKQRLYDGADDLGAAGFDPQFGFGRINATKTLLGSNNGNQAPVLSPIGNKSVAIGQLLTFNVSAIDPDGDTLTYYNIPVIEGSSFVDQIYTWTPNSAQAGTYNVTFTVSDGSVTDNETIAVTVKTTAPASVFVSPTSVQAGQAVTVAWGNIASPTTKDWIGLYVVGSGDTTYKAWKYTTGVSSGTTSLTVPAGAVAGTYEVRLFSNGGYTLLAKSGGIAVTAAPAVTVSVSPTSVQAGQAITVAWGSIASPTTKDWIGLYVVGSGDTTYKAWKYITGTASGTTSLTVPAGAVAGTYEVRLFSNGGYTLLAKSGGIAVTAAPAVTLSVSPTSVQAGQAVTVAWGNIASPTTKDWIGLYVVGSGDTTYKAWKYTTGVSSGTTSLTVPAGAVAGTYEVRLFSNGGYTLLAKSGGIAVTAAPAVTLSVSPASVQAGQAITVAWGSIASPTTKDWIGLYVVGSGDTTYKAWKYITGTASGTTSLTVPAGAAAGTYEVRLFSNNTYTVLAKSNSLTVMP